MASYQTNINTILNGVYGKDVREAIASCLSADMIPTIDNYISQYGELVNSVLPPSPGSGTLAIALISDDDYLLTISSSQ